MHRKEQHRAVQKRNRERMEGVVKQISVAQRKRGGPIKMGEDTKRNRLTPSAHEHRTNQTQHKKEPDGRSKGPCHMRTHTKLTCAAIHARPPEQHGGRQKQAGNLPPATLIKRREAETMRRRRRL